jgi:hypothetical protein
LSYRFPFPLFLATFLLLYGTLHGYLYWKLRQAIPLRMLHHAGIIGSLLVFLLLPVATVLFARYEGEHLAAVTACLGYYWMGAIFLFFCIRFTIDLLDGATALLNGRAVSKIGPLRFGKGARILFTSGLVLGILVYGTLEARSLRIRKVEIGTAKLPAEKKRFRIVQISDVHFGPLNGNRLAEAIADEVNALDPDVLVSTGDLIDRGMKEEGHLAGILAGIKAPLGKFAVLGNHEVYAGIRLSAAFMEKAGFRLLRNESLTLPGGIRMVGMDDPAVLRSGFHADALEHALLSSVPEGDLTVLLKHQPRVLGKNPGRFDLQLSGHTHRGQIFPFGLITARVFPYHYGLYNLEGERYVYVSAGTGTWGPPVRFLAPPEITVIDFCRPAA